MFICFEILHRKTVVINRFKSIILGQLFYFHCPLFTQYHINVTITLVTH